MGIEMGAEIFATSAASFVKSDYPYELRSNLHNLHINPTQNTLKSYTIEKLSRDVEWVANIFYHTMSGWHKMSFEPDPPLPQIMTGS